MASELHDKLCEIAGCWLAGKWKCAVVAVEPVTWAVQEQPDAFGWDIHGGSHLVECKVSLDDFRRDAHKPHRGIDGMGTFRWYLAPKGVIPVDKLPPYWGLAVVSGKMKGVRIEKPAWDRPFTDARARREVGLLACMVRRSHGYEKVLRVDPKTLEGMAMARVAPEEFQRDETEEREQ